MNVRDRWRMSRTGARLSLALCLMSALAPLAWTEPAPDEPASATIPSPSPGRSSGERVGMIGISTGLVKSLSIAQFSARRPAEARELLPQRIRAGSEAARAAATLVPFLPAPAPIAATASAPSRASTPSPPRTAGSTAARPTPQTRPMRGSMTARADAGFPRLSAAAQLETRAREAARAAVTEPAAPPITPSTLGREISAFAADDDSDPQSEIEAQPRRRAAFQSAMQRAAAQSALATAGAQSTAFQSSTSPYRFRPRDPRGQADPFGDGMREAAEAISLVPGLAISSAGLFAGYSSNSIPTRGLLNGLGGPLGSDYDYGAMATFSYVNRGRGSDLSISYTPSHNQRVNIEEWSTTNHDLSVSVSKELGARWTLNGTADGGYTGLEQYWLELPILHFPTDVPDTLEGLYEAVEAGQFTDEEFASILTGAPVVDDPGGRQMDLGRVLSLGASASGSYAYSPRWRFNFSGRTQRSNLRAVSRPDRPAIGGLYVADNSVQLGSASMSYRFSPRTSIGVSHTTARAHSDFADSLSNNAMISLSQRLSRALRYRVGLGIGAVNVSRTVYAVDPRMRATWTASGGLSYSLGRHSVSANASRNVGDTLGLGANTSTMAQLQWSWMSLRSPWIASAGFGVMRLRQQGGGVIRTRSLNSDLYSLGVGRRLSPSTLMRTDYYYGRYVSPFEGLFSNAQIHRLQVSLLWRPAERR